MQEIKKPHILLTNDDGIDAPGIRSVWNALDKTKFDIAIAAPKRQQSGAGLSITMNRPIEIKKRDSWYGSDQAWSIDGTPADCVKFYSSIISNKKPDLIISGVNEGTNSGCNVLYSGTVGAIMDASMRHIPGIAFSSECFINPTFEKFEKYIPHIVNYTLQHSFQRGSFFTVTFPKFKGGVQGIKMAKQGRSFYVDDPEEDKEKKDHYWMRGKWMSYEENNDSDIALLEKGFITIVPLHVEGLTDHSMYESHHSNVEKLNNNFTF
jgi:5'-nucleotidase